MPLYKERQRERKRLMAGFTVALLCGSNLGIKGADRRVNAARVGENSTFTPNIQQFACR